MTIELTVEALRSEIDRAVRCESVTVPAEDFRAIHDMAIRVKAYDNMKLGHLEALVTNNEIRLTGRELRILLMLAFEAVRANLPVRLRPVRIEK